jgi:phosphatidylglycerophosphatase C
MRQSKRAVNDTANVIAAFDFDGTITTRDTFLPFLGAAFGRRRLTGALMRLALDLIGSSGRTRSRDALKARLIAILFTGRDCSRLDAVARDFATRVTTHLLRPGALERVRWHRERGHRLVLVSASLDIYLTHLVERLGFDDLLCTRLSRRDGVFDGRLLGNNCRGAEKVARLEELIGGCERYQIYAYGDSAGDREMLRAADFPFYRRFRKRGDQA